MVQWSPRSVLLDPPDDFSNDFWPPVGVAKLGTAEIAESAEDVERIFEGKVECVRPIKQRRRSNLPKVHQSFLADAVLGASLSAEMYPLP